MCYIFQVNIEVEFIDQVNDPSTKYVWQLQTSIHIAIIYKCWVKDNIEMFPILCSPFMNLI